jgi:CheY-like chemotaxis protein
LLIVEDEPDSLEILKVVLSRYGADVTTASSAYEALKILETMRPNVLISDVGMPDVDGYELMHRVRSLDAERGGGILAIALTAYAREEDRKRALDAGFREHVAKPVDPATLVNVIATLVYSAGS